MNADESLKIAKRFFVTVDSQFLILSERVTVKH